MSEGRGLPGGAGSGDGRGGEGRRPALLSRGEAGPVARGVVWGSRGKAQSTKGRGLVWDGSEPKIRLQGRGIKAWRLARVGPERSGGGGLSGR